MGFIPQTNKVNQDSFCIQKDLVGQVSGLWIMGVMDGHGQNGHQVSQFCKKIIPEALSMFVDGAVPKDLSLVNSKLVNKRKRGNSLKNFLPNITASNGSQNRAGTSQLVLDADTWLSTD